MRLTNCSLGFIYFIYVTFLISLIYLPSLCSKDLNIDQEIKSAICNPLSFGGDEIMIFISKSKAVSKIFFLEKSFVFLEARCTSLTSKSLILFKTFTKLLK